MLETVLAQLAEQIAEQAARKVLQTLPGSSISEGTDGLKWFRYYSAKTLAQRWDMPPKAVYQISKALLPRRSFGDRRVRFYGLDVLRYEGTISPETYDALQKSRKPVLEDPPQEPARLWRLRHAVNQGDQ